MVYRDSREFVDDYIRAIRKQGKKVRANKKSALAFLVRAGICTKSGRLTSKYR
jgi:hypothetical protein